MGAYRHNLAFVHNGDLMGAYHGVQAVGDHQDGTSLNKAAEGPLNLDFRVGVGKGRRLIHDQDRCVDQQGACNRQTLGLAARQLAVGADDAVVAFGKRHDESVDLRGLGGSTHLFQACLRF